MAHADPRSSIRRAVAWVFVAALCVAALTAIAAVVTGDFDQTDGRVIASSLGFAVFSATAASGASLRQRGSERLRALGLAAVTLSAAGFLLMLAALWDDNSEDTWRWFGCTGLAALACSHASLVSGAMRASDRRTVRALGRTSIALGVLDACIGVLAVSGAADEVDGAYGQLLAVLVILLLLSTALPPVLRRLERAAVPAAPAGPLAAQVLAAADRIEALNGDPGNRASEIRRECERLRELARSHS